MPVRMVIGVSKSLFPTLLVLACLVYSISVPTLCKQVGASEPGGAKTLDWDDAIDLFNGNDLTGWDGDPRLWAAGDGVIHGETTREEAAQGNTFLIWQGGDLQDFALKVEYRCSASNNSGIQYRSNRIEPDSAKNPWVVQGYQHEIRNENSPPNVPGFIYEEGGKRGRICLTGQKVVWSKQGQKLVEQLLNDEQIKDLVNIDDWNESVIVARGNHIRHYLNGELIVDFTDEDPKATRLSGVLALQLHAGKPMWVEFKKVALLKFQ